MNFSSDYRLSNTATTLNPNSNLVNAVGGKAGCTGLQAVGGVGTYYAQVINAAQAYLVAEQTLYPSSQNVLIILGDGDSNGTLSNMPGASTTSEVYISTNRNAIRRLRQRRQPRQREPGYTRLPTALHLRDARLTPPRRSLHVRRCSRSPPPDRTFIPTTLRPAAAAHASPLLSR